MKAKSFDRKFDQGDEDILEDLDLSTARRTNQTQKRINVDFPAPFGPRKPITSPRLISNETSSTA